MQPTRLAHAARSLLAALTLAVGAPALGADPLTQAIWQGDMDRSLALVRDRIAKSDADFEAHSLYIDLLSSMGFARAAAAEYRQRIAPEAATADAWALVGRAEPNPQAALAAYALALSIQPDHAPALTGKAGVQRALGKEVSAIETYTAAIAADPSMGEAWTGLAQAWLSRGATDSALQTARKARTNAPDDPSVWLLLATLAPGEARTVLTEATGIHPEIPQLWSALARAHFEEQEWSHAAKAYDKALSYDPPDAPALRVERALVTEIRTGALDMTGAAVILDIRGIAQQDVNLAMTALATLAEEQPKSGQVRLVYGNMLRAIGNYGAAETQLKAARDLMPDDADAWSALGGFYLDRRQPAEARPLLEQAARTRPEDPVLAVAAAMAAAEAGDVAAAELSLRAAIARFPGSVGPVLGLARLLITSNRGTEALDVLTDAIRKQAQVELALALVSTGKELGQAEDALVRLEKLAEETGDPRLNAAAKGLRVAASQPTEGGGSDGP